MSELPQLNRREFVIATAAAACGCMLCGIADAADAPVSGGPQQVDVGAKTDYAKDGIIDKFAAPNRILVVRQDGKIYALSATCTHKNATLKTKDGEIVCAKHGSKFSPQGNVTKGPAKISLFRYAIAANDKGHIIVDKSKQFDEKHWDDPAASIAAA